MSPDVVENTIGAVGDELVAQGAEQQLGEVIAVGIGAAGFVAMRDGRPFSVAGVTVRDGKIVEMDFLADPERLAGLALTVLDG